MKRTDILDAARQAVTVDRAATHGQLEDSFGLIAAYWSAHLDTPVSRSDVAVMMIQLKLARIRTTPEHADHWIDVAGYAACGGEVAKYPVSPRLNPQGDGYICDECGREWGPRETSGCDLCREACVHS
jgi:hypothetical protein